MLWVTTSMLPKDNRNAATMENAYFVANPSMLRDKADYSLPPCVTSKSSSIPDNISHNLKKLHQIFRELGIQKPLYVDTRYYSFISLRILTIICYRQLR